MKIQILRKPSPPSSYRGVGREPPYYRDDEPDNSAFNHAFLEICARGETFDFDSPAEALRYGDIFNSKEVIFDVIGVQPGERHPDSGFLGYDVASNGRESILSSGIHWDERRRHLQTLGPLLALIEGYFRPKLNEFGLFSDYASALHFRDVLGAVQSLSAEGVWEAKGHYHPEVLAVSGLFLTP